MRQVYLAIGPFCWGKADDIETAIRRAKYNWIKAYSGDFDRKKMKIYLFLVPEEINEDGISLNQDGMLTYTTKVTKIDLQLYPESKENEN